MAIILDGTAGITTPALSNSGNLTFTGTGNRITGDFSNATHSNRVLFQTSTTNGNTIVGFIPNGTSTQAQLNLYPNADPSNTSSFQLAINTTASTVVSGITGTGTYLPMTFYTGGSERMRIDTSGNVGIGTSSPDVKLRITGANVAYKGQMVIDSTDYAQITAYNGSTQYGQILWGTTSGGAASVGMTLGTTTANPIIFSTNNTERMRIDSSGNLLVGTTTNNTNCKIVASANSGVSSGIEVQTNNSAANAAMYFYNPNGIVGSIITNGSATSFNTSSDYRLKENIQPMQNALARNALLKPVTYQWKSDKSKGEGFIAHELQEIVPSCVTGEKDAVDADGNPVYQGIDTSFLVGHLVACINELKAEIDELKAKVN